jgi:DNA-directed RNA polymerase specialized sigma24 family protein
VDASEPPGPPKDLATEEEKLELLRDERFLRELRASIGPHVLKADADDALQLTLMAIVKSPVPKEPSERLPYCKAIAENTAKRYSRSKATKPDAKAEPLDHDIHDAVARPHASTPEDIVGARRVLAQLLERTVGRRAHRSWIRADIAGMSHADIAKRAGVAPKTVTNTLSVQRRDLREMFKNALVLLLGVGSLSTLAENVLLRPGRSGGLLRSPFGGGVSSAVAYVAIVLFGAGAFAAVAWRTRARRRVVLAALSAAATFTTYSAWWGKKTLGNYWGTLPDFFTDTASFVIYATQALAFAGAGALLAYAAAKRYGLKGFLAILVAAGSLGTLSSGLVGEAFGSVWLEGSIMESLGGWWILLLPLYAFVWWQGAEAKPIPADDGR